MVTIKHAIDDLNKSELVGENICTTEGELIILLEELQRLRDAEEQGLLLRLPCKVGDTVYYINFSQGKIEEDTVMEFSLEFCDWYVRLKNLKWVHLDRFKHNFYLAKEEAEKKRAEMKGE